MKLPALPEMIYRIETNVGVQHGAMMRAPGAIGVTIAATLGATTPAVARDKFIVNSIAAQHRSESLFVLDVTAESICQPSTKRVAPTLHDALKFAAMVERVLPTVDEEMNRRVGRALAKSRGTGRKITTTK